jgi:uroporphyrinogen decarboxylase
MNSLERLIASSKGEPTDRVPVAPGIGHYAAVMAGKPLTQVAYDPELMAKVVLQSLERHGYDSISPITDYGLGTECMGSKVIIRDREQIFVSSFPVESNKDIARLRIPDPMKHGRMPVIIKCEQILVEKVGTCIGVNGGLAGPLSFAANLRGTGNILYDVVDRPELVHNLLEISLEAIKSFGEAQVIHGGVNTINVYEPVATLISSRMVEEFSFSYLEGLIRFLKGLGAKVLLHICGDTKRLLNRMVEIGADIVSLDVDVDLVEAKRIIAGRASISGNVSIQHLATSSSDVIYAESCECIRKAAEGGRFTLSSSCEVPLETPPVNIDAMVRAAREYGGFNPHKINREND